MTASVVLIAIERYAGGDKWNRLKGPVKDALEFAGWLMGKGVEAANIHVRISAHDQAGATAQFQALGVTDLGAATRDSIRMLFKTELPAWPAGDLIVYWSGHGWFGERTLCLSPQESTSENMLLISIDSLRELLASSAAKAFRRQMLFFDACAKFIPENSKAEEYDHGSPLHEIEQWSFYAASPGEGAVETNGTGHFNLTFWEECRFPFDQFEIRNFLELAYEKAVKNGTARQRPFTIGHSMGKLEPPTWRGVWPRVDQQARLAKRAELTPKILEQLAKYSAACASFATAESRDALVESVTGGAVLKRPEEIRSDVFLDFQWIWALAREKNAGPSLLQEMEDAEGFSVESSELIEYASAADPLQLLIDVIAGLGIPSRIWRAWTDEVAINHDWANQYDLEDLFEPFFTTGQPQAKRERLFQILARAYRRGNDRSLLQYLEAQVGWKAQYIAEAAPKPQIVHLEASCTAGGGVSINGIKLWRPITRSYRTVDVASLGLPEGLEAQLETVDQELTAKGYIAPEIAEIVYELALPAPALNTPGCHLPAHALALRWLDRLQTRDPRFGTGVWERSGANIGDRANDQHWKPRAKWLAEEKCCVSEALALLRGDATPAYEVIGLARAYSVAAEDRAQLLGVLASGAPYLCWHVQAPPAWDAVEQTVQQLLDAGGLPRLPLSVRGARGAHASLHPMVLFFDDPRRNPYLAKLTGIS